MIDFKIETTLFESDILSFLLPLTDPRGDEIVEDNVLQYNGRQFFVTIREERVVGGELLLYIEAEESWMKLADALLPGSTEIEATPGQGLADILASVGWVVIDLSEEEVTEYFLEATDASILDLCWQWAKICGQELQFYSVSNYVVIAPTIGTNLPYVFSYGKNMTEIKRTTIPPSATRIYAYGRNELDITSVTGGDEFIEDFSYYTASGMTLADARIAYRKDLVLNDDSFIEAQALYDAAAARLASLSQPTITYEAKVVDLSDITEIHEGEYDPGDSVIVRDPLLSTTETARVTRRIQYPIEPHRDELELSFNPYLIPDSQTSAARSNTTKSWELFVSRNDVGRRQIRNWDTILHRVTLQTIEDAEWVVGYTIMGVGVGSGTIEIEPIDDETGLPLWPTQTFTVADGVAFEWDFTYGEKQIPKGTHPLTIRCVSSGAGVGLDIAEKQTAFWVLARGATRKDFTLDNSVRYDCTGSVQTFQVPDDVLEINIEAVGAAGAGASITNQGMGGSVSGRFPVLAGTVYDVYVGCKGTNPQGGFPNGGRGVTANNQGSGGGGSSSVQPQGVDFITTLPNALIVAPAGGGHGSHDVPSWNAGNGNFFGDQPYPGGTDADAYVGSGATGTAGGISYQTPGPADGAFGYGGWGFAYGAQLRSEGGGGGGGWYGGAAAAADWDSEGGGGGSGFVHASGFDIEIIDAQNSGAGYIIISWDNPE